MGCLALTQAWSDLNHRIARQYCVLRYDTSLCQEFIQHCLKLKEPICGPPCRFQLSMYSLLEFDYSRLFYFYLSISLVISCWIVLLSLPYFISRLDIFHSGFRAYRDGPLDNLLEGLKDRLKTTVLSSKANGTVMVYNRAFRGWNQFANDKLHGKTFPASPFHVALHLQHLLEETHSTSVF